MAVAGAQKKPGRVGKKQRQMIWSIAVDFVGRQKYKRRFRAKLSRRFQQVERAIRVYAEVGLRIARGPIMRRLRCAVDHGKDIHCVFLE